MEKNTKYNYTYIVWEEGWPIIPGSRVYIGSRGCNISVEKDYKYMGSFKDKTFKPKYKKVLKTFQNRLEAYEHEVYLHEKFNVDKNPYFANKSKQLISGFSRAGARDSEETKSKKKKAIRDYYLNNPSARIEMGEITKGKKWFTNGFNDVRGFYCPDGFKPGRSKTSSPMKGKKHTEKTKQKLREIGLNRKQSQETREKIRIANSGRKHSIETKRKISEGRLGENNPAYGSKWFTNGTNNIRAFECPIGYRRGRTIKKS